MKIRNPPLDNVWRLIGRYWADGIEGYQFQRRAAADSPFEYMTHLIPIDVFWFGVKL